MINVKGYRVLVKPKEVETETESGIIVTIQGSQEEKLEKAGQQFGTVVGIGSDCWSGDTFREPWCNVGDTVLFSRHAGRFVYDPASEDDEYMIMNDTDILAVVS